MRRLALRFQEHLLLRLRIADGADGKHLPLIVERQGDLTHRGIEDVLMNAGSHIEPLQYADKCIAIGDGQVQSYIAKWSLVRDIKNAHRFLGRI
jgi:hypothetical protein